MKAAILEGKGVLTYQEVPTPAPQAGNLLLQVKAVSICGSDIKRYVSGHRMYPLILGHEAAGIVAEVGEGVKEDWVGKHVAVIPLVPCFECEQCKSGFYSACHSYSFIGSREAGAFAEYMEIPEKNAYIIPDDLPFDYVSLIEPSTVARHMLSLGNFKAGETAVVLGAGSIGLMIVQWLRILGAKRIICTDISDENLATAADLAHKMDVCMEAEIGAVPKPNGEELDVEDLVLTDPDDALEFVQKTGVDMLAIALGSVHGMQTKENDLDLERLEEIHAKVDLPLVLHGSSGVTNEVILAAIKMGLSKINITTQLNKAFTLGIRKALAENNMLVDPRKYLTRGMDAQIEVVRERIQFLGSSGKAGL